ncbi:hypothetical protein IFR05_016571 [Cadophora sp. M221]|nr:hypothetical protein IFR05_016571 [Cadophora sp. M221]
MQSQMNINRNIAITCPKYNGPTVDISNMRAIDRFQNDKECAPVYAGNVKGHGVDGYGDMWTGGLGTLLDSNDGKGKGKGKGKEIVQKETEQKETEQKETGGEVPVILARPKSSSGRGSNKKESSKKGSNTKGRKR